MTQVPNPWGTAIDIPTGDPLALGQAVEGYAHTQMAIERAAADLLDAMFHGEGMAMAALGEAVGKAESSLIAAHGRYEGTTSALRDYTVELASFHYQAQGALEREQQALRTLDRADQLKREASTRLLLASVNPDYAIDLDSARADLWAADAAVAAAQEEVNAPRYDYRRAAEAWEDAAQMAIQRIVASFDGTNDGLWDHVQHAFTSVGEMLAELEVWAQHFLAGVLDVVMAAVELYLEVVTLTITLVALTVVLVVALVLAVAVLVVVLGIVLGALLSLLWAGLAGAAMYDLTEKLGIGGLAQIRLVLMAACAASPLLAVVLVTRIADEAGKPAPTVAPLRRHDAEEVAALQQLDSAVPTSAADVLAWAGLVDEVGADQRAVVDIAKVTQENGLVAWIVTVPSTQDWVMGQDRPAPNDLDADLVLFLFPELRTQYERGVLDAMAQAGIPKNEPVLLSGWSLGGIGGGRLIESGDGGYWYAGLICAGSPIDHMAIPPDVNVLQVKHTMDLVHRADLIEGFRDTAGHVSLWDGPQSGGVVPVQGNPLGAHNNDAYVETLRAHTLRDDSASAMFSDFYAIDNPATAAVPRVQHRQYEFSE